MAEFFEMIWNIIVPFVTIMVMLIGLFGLVIPIFPGGLIIWAAALIYGIIEGFGAVGGWMFAIITILAFASAAADNVLMGAKAREAGASWRGIGLGLVAGIVSSFFITPILGMLGVTPLVLFLHENYRLQNKEEALAITKGLMFGFGWAFLARFGLGIIKIILWVIWAFNV